MATVPASAVTANDATQKGELGQIYIRGSKEYRYYKIADITTVVGYVVTHGSTANTVTPDITGGTGLGVNAVAGVATGATTAGNYGWVQTGGIASCYVASAVTVTAGDLVAPHPSINGAVVTATTTNIRAVFGVATSTDTATTSGVAGRVNVSLFRV